MRADLLAVAPPHSLDEGVLVHGHVDGLTHAHVGEDLVCAVHGHELHTVHGILHDLEGRVALKGSDLLVCGEDEVDVVGTQRAGLRRGLGQHAQLDVGDIGCLTPIAGICLEHHRLLRSPGNHLVGAGAYGLVGQRVCHRRVDHGAPSVGKVGEHGHVELGGGHLHGALVNGLEGVAGILALSRCGVVLQAQERRHDGVGVAGVAVGKHKALAQLEGGDQAVLGGLPRLGKAGHKLAGRRHLEQRVIHAVRGLEGRGGRRAMGVEAIGVNRDAHDELVRLSRRVLRGGRRIRRLVRTSRLSRVRVLRAAPGKREQTGAGKQAGTRKRASRQGRTRRFRSSGHHNTFLKN